MKLSLKDYASIAGSWIVMGLYVGLLGAAVFAGISAALAVLQ